MLLNKFIFKQFFKTDNKLYGLINIKDLLNQEIEIPNEQRLKLTKKVDDIITYQDLYFKKYNCFNFQGTINIHYCEETNKYYLVDGQHRYFAIKDLVENHKYKNEYIILELIQVKTLGDLRENFNIINKNTKMPKFPQNLNKSVIEKVSFHLFEKYPNFWSDSSRPQKPNINQTHLQEGIAFLYKELNILLKKELTENELLKIILDKNKEIGKKNLLKLNILSRLKTKNKIINKCEEAEFYLGIYTHKSNESCYGWIQDILNDLKPIKKQIRKQRIPPILKNKVWVKYIGDKIETNCLCCNKTIISITSFHCGHIKAEANGGKLTIENLRPICGSCNSSMGTQNMKDYTNKFFEKENTLNL